MDIELSVRLHSYRDWVRLKHNTEESIVMEDRDWNKETGRIRRRKECLVSQNTTSIYVAIFINRLTTCFGPYDGPSSGHKTYKEKKLYSVSHKIWYII
jgi:hypothetical protein